MAKPTNTTATITAKPGGDYSVTEDSDAFAAGALSIIDPDPGQAAFQSVSVKNLTGLYGIFGFNSSTGAWTYTLDNTKAATQALKGGATATDTLTVTSLDGTASAPITVAITGTNDIARISGTATGGVTEAGGTNNLTKGQANATGTLLVSDADAGEAIFKAPATGLTGMYGTFSFNSTNGKWAYTLDDAKSATQALTSSQTVHDTLTVSSLDGSASQIIDVTVIGANDSAIITGTATGNVGEAGGANNSVSGAPSATGTLAVADPDAAQSAFRQVLAANLDGTYGKFSFEASSGAWSYALDNSKVGTEALAGGQIVHDTLTVTSLDGSANQVINVTITGANDAPIARDDAATTRESTSVTISNVLANDSDPDTLLTPASVSGYTQAAHGTVSYNYDGSFIYTPSTGFSGADNFSYTISDGQLSSTATVSITVDAVQNHAPALTSPAATLQAGMEDNAYLISAMDLLAGFSDIDGDTLSVSALSADHGSITDNGDGTYTITPAANYNGAVSLSYNVIDGHGGSVAANQSFTLAAVNDAPAGAASANLAAGTEDTAYVVSGAALLAGFGDADGDTLSVSALGADHGSITDNGDGTYTITPAANYNGAVGLSYNVIDGHGGSVAATQSFTLAAVNDAPVGTATATLAAGTEDTAYVVSAAALLAGFGDVDGDTLSVSTLGADHGNITNNGDGTYTITPAANYNGAVNLSYSVTDGHGGTAPATQSFTLAAVNDAPAGAASATLAAGTEDTAYVVSAAALLAGFGDVDGDTLNVSALGADHGSVVNNGNGTYTITPDANYSGAVGLSYNVIDDHGGSVAATQSFTLAAVNDAPVGTASASLATGTEDTAYVVSAAALLAGFGDVDGDTLAISSLISDHGSVVNNGDGTYTITPTANYNGAVNLSYSVTDGHGGTAPATQSFTLAAVNDVPAGAARATLAAGTEDTAYVVSAAALLAGFGDVDGDTLNVSALGADHGSVVNNGNGTYTITPDANYNGAVSLSYNVIDGHGGSVATTQSFTLAAVNDAPVGTATATLAAGTEDTAYVVSAAALLAGFGDVDGDTLSVSALSADHGSINDNGDGTYTITPDANYNGAVSLSYNVIDGHGGSVAATQSFTLAAVNDAPVGTATATLVAGTEDTAYVMSAAALLTGFGDVDGDALNVSPLTSDHGSVVNNGNGTYTITPTANYNGTVNLSYSVTDGQGGSVAATQSFTLAAVNDAPAGAASASLAAGTEDTAYVVSVAALLVGFGDVDGDTLSVSALSADHGSITNNGDGTYTITPAANYNGAVSLSYSVTDGYGGSVAATQSFTLAAVNDAPVGAASASLAAGTEDTAYVVSAAALLTGFGDVDGDALNVSSLTSDHGSVVNNGNGTYTITPTANYNGTVNLSYSVTDGHGGSVAATQSFTLAAVNDAPVGTASATLATGAEDTAYVVSAAALL
ncbi:VCBS repeat-containing protein, partial [Duganella sp. 1411]|uniref:beta strand repeat-containing protein n=1 Tax=Duganella sp. 1411 TaxID=2806572 RepID=UPI001AE72343|nr:VCBS repeat-containing protein [Duganella sp. 1411]